MAGGAGAKRSFMVRTKKHKYMAFHTPAKAEMFFDLEADPGEMKNLLGRADLSAEIDRHRNLLEEWCKLTDMDKYPIQPNPVAGKRAARKKT